jgi:hypothetical protein
MMRGIAGVIAALTLSGCATAPPEPQIVTKLVNVPVAVKCVPDPAPVAPVYADSPAALAAAPNVFERVKLIMVGKMQRDGFIGELSAVVKACGG